MDRWKNAVPAAELCVGPAEFVFLFFLQKPPFRQPNCVFTAKATGFLAVFAILEEFLVSRPECDGLGSTRVLPDLVFQRHIPGGFSHFWLNS